MLDRENQRQKGKFGEMDESWEESWLGSEEWWIATKLVMTDALRLKIRIIYKKFKLWFYPDGWNRLFGIHTHPSDLVTSTKEIWGRKLRRDISDEEATGIIRSFSNFFSLLKEIRANGK